MKLSRRFLEGGMVTAALALTSVAPAVCAKPPGAVRIAYHTIDEEYRGAGTEEKTLRRQEVNWGTMLLANVGKNTWLNVREKPTTNSKVVGRLYRGYGATVKKKGDEWTQIVSGKIKGYVKNEYCVFGEEAKSFAEKNCDTQITVTEDGLRVRKGSDDDSAILALLGKGDTLKTDGGADETADWVSVQYNGKKAYVSADYVTVGYQIGTAAGVEKKKTAKKKTKAKTKTGETAVKASAVASDDLRLLAAIIECEAGGEPYEGQLAVGAVVVNRVQSGSFPDSISDVIYQNGQFTPAGSGKLSRVLSSGKIRKSCYQAAKEALGGSDNTGGAKFFHAGTNGKGTVIGSQIFY